MSRSRPFSGVAPELSWLPCVPDAIDVTRSALVLGLDGVLLPFQPRGSVHPVGRPLRSLLRKLVNLFEARVAVFSGRPVAEMNHLLGGVITPLVGCHGLEWRDATGADRRLPRHPGVSQAVRESVDFAQHHADVYAEVKPNGVALHYRDAPDFEPVAELFARDLARRTGLGMAQGELVEELLPEKGPMGEGLARLMASKPFRGHKPVYIGRQSGEERVMPCIRRIGGRSILVGDIAPTQATYQLRDVVAVRRWLRHAARTGAVGPLPAIPAPFAT